MEMIKTILSEGEYFYQCLCGFKKYSKDNLPKCPKCGKETINEDVIIDQIKREKDECL
jgi:predicted  nucleic acid-binding Zn ribbon protein